MAMSELNCSESDRLPLSEDYFAVLTDGEFAGIGICAVLTLINIFILIDNIIVFHRHFSEVKRVMLTALWLVALCPTLSLISLIAMLIPRASLLRDFLMIACVSVVMYKFVQHLKAFIHAKNMQGKAIVNNVRFNVRPFACCCPCLPTKPATPKLIQIMKGLVLQCAIISLIITAVTMFLWIDEKYESGKIAPDNAFPYLQVVRIVSTIVAIYALSICFNNLDPDFVNSFYARQKYAGLQLTLISVNLQRLIFSIMLSAGVWEDRNCISARVFSNYAENVAFIVEMFLIALLNLWSYRRPVSFGGPPDLEVAGRVEEVIEKSTSEDIQPSAENNVMVDVVGDGENETSGSRELDSEKVGNGKINEGFTDTLVET